MIEYIKKLKTCIRWLMELEDGYLAEQEKLRSMLDSEERRHAEIGNCHFYLFNWDSLLFIDCLLEEIFFV